jgi:hypothetical protein
VWVVATELSLLGVATVEGARLLLLDWGRRPFLWSEWLTGWNPPLLALFVLLGLRTLASEAEPRSARAGLAPGRWLVGFRQPEWILAGAFLLALSFAAHPGPSLGADARPFLAQLHGLLFEGRLPVDPLFEPGPALVWLPFYAVSHALVKAGAAAGPADGWSSPYLNAVRVGSLVSAFLASLITLNVVRRYFPPRLAALAVAIAWLASPLLYYTIAEPAMAHAPATLAVSVFVLLWVRARERPEQRGRFIALAAAGGFVVSMQRYDVFYLVAPAFDVARLLLRTGFETPRRLARLLLAAGVALAVGLLPLLWMAALGRGTTVLWQGGLLEPNLRYWREPRVLEVLFASRGGFLAWTPVAGLGLVGLLFFARRERGLGGGLLLALAAGLVLLGSNWAWAGSWAFGSRRLTEFAPALALGLACVFEFLLLRPTLLLAAASALLVAWNVSLISLVQRGRVPQDATFSFGEAASVGVREWHESFGNPSAFPAPWIFAWRHGVPAGRFDDLFGRDPRREWGARLGTAADAPLLGRGWSPPQPGGGRAALAEPATLLVVLPQPDACRLFVVTGIGGLPEPPAESVSILVNGFEAAAIDVPGAREVSVPVAFWKEGANEIGFAAGRLSAAAPGHWRLDSFELRCGASR